MGRILVVDDEPVVRELVRSVLEPDGHVISEASSAERAFEVIAESPPDLIILDVILPGIHGFEAARRIKAQPRNESVPILLISVLHDHSSRLLGLRMGADDFLAKPLDRFELTTRVTNLLSQRTERLVLAQRNADLVELDRFKEELSTMVVHDLKNPIAVIQANLEYMASELAGAAEAQRSDAVLEALADTQAASKRVVRLLGNLLDVSRIETNRFELKREILQLATLFRLVGEHRTQIARGREITLEVDIPAAVTVSGDADVLERVVENILDNALRYAPRRGRISIVARRVPDRPAVELRIGNTGPGITPEVRAVVFEKFGRASGGLRMNLGLGMYFCRLAVQSHGGRIWIDQEPDLPTVFVIELPVDPALG